MIGSFEVRSFTSAGDQDKILSGARIEFTDELGVEGYVKVTLPRARAIALGLQHRTEVAVFLDGVELEGSRGYLVETTGNPSSSDEAAGEASDAVWGGRTLHAGTKGINTYPTVFPVLTGTPQNYVFTNKTPGFILKKLLDDAKARGAANDISYSTWGSLTDSNGVGWAKPLTLEIKPGTDLKSIIENMINLGAIEFRWDGRQFKIYNAETFGMDWTTGADQICLYRGREVVDSPYSESSDEVVNALLIMGDNGVMIEKVDTDSIAQYGRREGTLSQGGTTDLGMLNFLGETTLSTSAKMRGEYTVKIHPTPTGARPFFNYRVGDWILYDRVAGQPPEKFRVRQISITSDGDTQSIVLTLNDKFAELDLRTAKKMEGMVGGSMDGSTPVTPPTDVDTLDPSPPTNVGSTSRTYVDGDGATRSVAITSWVDPTTNVDGSPLTDLAGFDVQHRTSSDVAYTASTEWYPGTPDLRLQARWDRRGKDTINTWVGADGGASVRAANGDDWFFWSDTNWGRMAQDGKLIEWNSMPRSSITKSDPTTLNELRGYVGRKNMLEDGPAYGKSGWVQSSNGTISYVTGGWGADGNSVRTTASGTAAHYVASPRVTVTAGAEYFIDAQIDPSSTAANISLRYQWNATGTTVVAPASGIVTAPDTANDLRILVYVSGPTAGQWAGVSYAGIYESNHALQTWQPQTHSEVVYNEITNPDGFNGTSSTGSDVLVATNYSTNPSGEAGVSAWSIYTSTTRERVVDSSKAWVGSAFMRFTTTGNSSSNRMMHYRIPVGTETQVGARFRIRAPQAPSGSLRIFASLYEYSSSGGRVAGGDTSSGPIILTDAWQEVVVPSRTMSTGGSIGMMFLSSVAGGFTWPEGAVVDIDGVEIYGGTTPPPFYFDGNTVPPVGYRTEWTGTPDASASSLYLTSEIDRNYIENPRVYSGLADYSTISGTGTTITRTNSQIVGQPGALGPVPEIVGASALDPWFTSLGQAASKTVGIGFIGDSCTESTGNESNPDLSDRFIERVQAALRKHTAVSGIKVNPKGYYGGSTYIPAGYIHNGPVDWTFETADESKFPLQGLQSGIGPGGRFRNLKAGHRAHFTAWFDTVRIYLGRSGWGRRARIFIDGDSKALINTNGAESTVTWTSANIGYGEHTVVVQFEQVDGLDPDAGSSTLIGAQIWDGDRTKGVRAYDLSGSGKAAWDVANSPREMDDDFNFDLSLLVIKLGFNDAGRTPPWGGGTRSSAAFKNDVLAIISGARSRGYTGPVLLVGQWQASQLVTTEPQVNYRTKLREIANADSTVAFIDLSTVMPDTVGDTTGMYSDGLHPSTKGHERVAEVLYHTLTPTPAGEASVQVSSPGTSALAGVEVKTRDHSTPWAVNTPYSVGVWVKAPAGAQMRLRTLATGNTGLNELFVGTGNWQFVTSTPQFVQSGATSAPYFIVRTAAAEKMIFWVSRAIMSKNPVTEYFDGGTSKSGLQTKWVGSLWNSQSIITTTTPAGGWSTFSNMQLQFDPTQRIQGEGSVRSSVTAPINAPGAVVNVSAPAGKFVTAIVLVKTNFEVDTFRLYLRNGSTVLNEVRITPNPNDAWTEVRLYAVPTSDVTSIRISAFQKEGATAPVGSCLWISEATLVATDGFYWRGSPFHGGQSGQGVQTEWVGIPHGSRSKGTFHNSSSTPNYNQGGALFHPAAAGGNISEYVWVTGAVKSATGNNALVVCNGMRNRALREGGGWNFQRNGTLYIAEFDMTTSRLTRWAMWFDDPLVQWGDAMWHDGGYLYIYGSGGSDAVGHTYVMRVPSSDPFGGARTFWNGTAWVSNPSDAVAIATSAASGGFSGVRTFNGKWIAIHVGGYMNHMDGWEAPAPQGPWTKVGPVTIFAEKSNFSIKYSARFHPQLDTAKDGIAIGYSEAGQNGNEVYGVKFIRGPKGSTTPTFDPNGIWEGHPFRETSPDHQGFLSPGWSYQARVRSRDRNDRVSPWVEGAPIVLTGDVTPPPKPAKPIATTFFRGARIVVSGLTAAGGAYPPDFSRLTVHQSTTEDFIPSDSNLIDTLSTKGGVVISSGLTWGVAYFWRVVAWDMSDNASEPSDPTTAQSERLSDPDLPEKLIDGAKHIKDESLSVKNFSVGAFGNTIVPNGNMEEHEDGAELPTGWTKGWPRGEYSDWDTAATFVVDTTNPVAGSKSVRITPKIGSSRQLVSPAFPLTPGDVYYVKAKIRTSRKLGSDFIEIGLAMGETMDTVNGFGSASSVTATAAVSDGSNLEAVTVEGQVEVPDYFGDGGGNAMRFGSFFVHANHDGMSSYSVWVDDVEVRQIVGQASIANASINRAKIRYLAVDDARISSVGVGKLVAGELWADITVSARIMTSKTGQRVELNRDGLFGYNGTASTPVTEVRSDTGGVISRWIRTNTTGTRIEMGSYGMGAGSALMSFHPTGTTWQFPPAFGFGGDYRQGSIPGIAMHAGSYTVGRYHQYGMNIIAVDQVGGARISTGSLLDGTEGTTGAPIRLDAGGKVGTIDLRSGVMENTNSTDRARILLSPQWPGRPNPDAPLTRFDMNYGTINFLPAGTTSNVSLRHVFENEWAPTPYYHVLLSTASGGFRISTNGTSEALIVSPFGILQGSGWDYAVKLGTEGTGQNSHFATIRYDGSSSPEVRVYNAPAGAMVAAKTFVVPHPKHEDKYLVHAAVEGPTADVFYRGRAVLNNGSAWVELPDYFEALTIPGSATVQVTPIYEGEDFAPVLRASHVSRGRFIVVGDTESPAAFFWEVKAERANTGFESEPHMADVEVAGDGPYTYIKQ